MFYSNFDQPNSCVYINNTYIASTNQSAIGPPKRVLINPNFRPTIHVNPNFTQAPKRNIHVNPNMLGKVAPQAVEPKVTKVGFNVVTDRDNKPPQVQDIAEVSSSRFKFVKTVWRVPEINVVSRFKVERKVPSMLPVKGFIDNVENKNEVKKHKSHFKIVNVGKDTQKTVKNRYKLDKRSKVLDCTLKKISQKMALKYNLGGKVSRNSKTALIRLNGILYKKSRNSLKRSVGLDLNMSIVKTRFLLKRTCSLNTANKNPFKKVNKRKSVDHSVRKRKTNNSLKIVDRKILNSMVLPSKMRKCNIPCPFFRKYGRCKGSINGTCNRVHNPDQIIICPKFLQGSCINKNCLLSHKVSPEKMPTCRYFLEGMCFREDCPYLHVKISPKADICQEFLRGFCKRGAQCDKRHQFLCPEFEKRGVCRKRRCPYPHQKAVRKSGSKPKLPINERKAGNESRKRDADLANLVRYYEDCEDESDKNMDVIESGVRKRPKLGVLPSFIPLDKIGGSAARD